MAQVLIQMKDALTTELYNEPKASEKQHTPQQFNSVFPHVQRSLMRVCLLIPRHDAILQYLAQPSMSTRMTVKSTRTPLLETRSSGLRDSFSEQILVDTVTYCFRVEPGWDSFGHPFQVNTAWVVCLGQRSSPLGCRRTFS